MTPIVILRIKVAALLGTEGTACQPPPGRTLSRHHQRWPQPGTRLLYGHEQGDRRDQALA
jgi:hypothetical protein